MRILRERHGHAAAQRVLDDEIERLNFAARSCDRPFRDVLYAASRARRELLRGCSTRVVVCAPKRFDVLPLSPCARARGRTRTLQSHHAHLRATHSRASAAIAPSLPQCVRAPAAARRAGHVQRSISKPTAARPAVGLRAAYEPPSYGSGGLAHAVETLHPDVSTQDLGGKAADLRRSRTIFLRELARAHASDPRSRRTFADVPVLVAARPCRTSCAVRLAPLPHAGASPPRGSDLGHVEHASFVISSRGRASESTCSLHSADPPPPLSSSLPGERPPAHRIGNDLRRRPHPFSTVR